MLSKNDILSINSNIIAVEVGIPEYENFDIDKNQWVYIPKAVEEFEDDDKYYVTILFRFKYENSDEIHTNGNQSFEGKTEKEVLLKIGQFLKEHKVKEYGILVF